MKGRMCCSLTSILACQFLSHPSHPCICRRPGRSRVGLFPRKRQQDRKRAKTKSRGSHRRASNPAVRHQGEGDEQAQWALGGRDHQRSRSVRARPRHRRDAGGGAGARVLRTHAGHRRSRRIAPLRGAPGSRPQRSRALTSIGAQLRRPERTQSWFLRISASWITSHTPATASTTVTTKAAKVDHHAVAIVVVEVSPPSYFASPSTGGAEACGARSGQRHPPPRVPARRGRNGTTRWSSSVALERSGVTFGSPA